MTITAEVVVTGAVTGTINCMHVCSGTSANYTVTLPAAAGNTGNLIGFRMAPIASLSKLVTLDGNGSEKINDSLTRVMWANESCILLCDGSNWAKIGGLTIPMCCSMYMTAAQTITFNTLTQLTLDTTALDNTGVMASTGSNLMTVRRPSIYSTQGSLMYGPGTAGNNVTEGLIYINGSLTFSAFSGAFGAVYGGITSPGIISLAAGDTVSLYAYFGQENTPMQVGVDKTRLIVTEIPTW